MKSLFTCTLGAAAALLAGCATSHNQLTLQSVGPQPQSGRELGGGTGTLVVYSARQENADFNVRDAYRPEYSNYEIFGTDGRLQQWVNNNSGTIFQSPVNVSLPAGHYQIVARANSYGTVKVPVVIAGGCTTVVHLEGSARWPDPGAFNEANAVRLPDGEIVGWKAL